MSEWSDRILQHPAWKSMETLGAGLDDAVNRPDIEAPLLDGIQRVRAVLTFVGKRLAGADPQLLHIAPLDAMNAAFQAACNELRGFASDGDANHITTANAHADVALTQLSTIPYQFVTDDWNALRDAGLAYRTSVEKHLSALQTRFAEIRSASEVESGRVATLESSITNEQSKLSTLTTEFQSQFSTAQEARNSQFSESSLARQEKFGTLITDYTQRLTDQNAEFTKDREAAVRKYQEELASLRTRFEEAASAALDRIQGHEQQVEKLVGVIGNLGVTSGYQKTAKTAQRATWFWQTLTVVSMGILIGFAYTAFLPSLQGQPFTWEGFAGRIFISLTVGVLAAYSAHQADKQGETERRNRKLALELEAIGPFLAPLPPAQQEAFRLEIGKKSFGRDEKVRQQDDRSPATVIDVLLKSKEFHDLLTEVVKAARV